MKFYKKTKDLNFLYDKFELVELVLDPNRISYLAVLKKK